MILSSTVIASKIAALAVIMDRGVFIKAGGQSTIYIQADTGSKSFTAKFYTLGGEHHVINFS